MNIGWLHIPKTGTSLLTALVHLANESLPDHAKVMDTGKRLQEEVFFNQWKPEIWFKNVTFWRDGIQHAPLNKHVMKKFQGNLFGMFRDPRIRGWSSYNFFAGERYIRDKLTPQLYASKCIKGTMARMLSGQLPQRPFGSLVCHVPAKNITADNPCPECVQQVPDMELAFKRLQQFNFVGLTDRWEESMCIFERTFNLSKHNIFNFNSRQTPITKNRTPREVFSMPENLKIFDDEFDRIVYKWAESRFLNDAKKTGC